MSSNWIAKRMHDIDASGIRRVFDLAANLSDPINLSIGQPHFDTPDPIKESAKHAIDAGRNAYSQSQGIKPLLDLVQSEVDTQYAHPDRKVFVTSGTSGGLMLALCTLVDPGDEVITFDPWFVMYKHLTTLAGGPSSRSAPILTFGSPSRRSALRSPSARKSFCSTVRATPRGTSPRSKKSMPLQNWPACMTSR